MSTGVFGGSLLWSSKSYFGYILALKVTGLLSFIENTIKQLYLLRSYQRVRLQNKWIIYIYI